MWVRLVTLVTLVSVICNWLYLAFGKSAFYRRFFEAISDCPVYNENGTDEIPPSVKDSTMNATEAFHFLDEVNHICYFIYSIKTGYYLNQVNN